MFPGERLIRLFIVLVSDSFRQVWAVVGLIVFSSLLLINVKEILAPKPGRVCLLVSRASLFLEDIVDILLLSPVGALDKLRL